MEQLPLLTFTESLFPAVDLSNIAIIAVQHVIDGTYFLFQSLYRKGLEPKDTYLLGKCYSSSKDSAYDIEKSGTYVSPLSFAFDSHTPFDEQYTRYVRDFLNESKSRIKERANQKRIVIVDDGGFLIDALRTDVDLKDKIVGAVELTSSGYTRLKDADLPFPVINVARSKTKLQVEGQMIAELGVKHVLQALRDVYPQARKVAVTGGGAIGKKIHDILNANDFSSHIYDIDPNAGTVDSLAALTKDSEIIVGATGTNSIPLEVLNEIGHKCLLISMSSSDREFPSLEVRRHFDKNSDAHKNYAFENLILMNSGFPINFTGERISLPLNQVQLTESLLLAAVSQVETEQGTGFVDLNERNQETILNTFFEFQPQLKKESLSKF